MDSEFATRTKTSASRQNLSIQLSSSVVTSIPGLQEGTDQVRPRPSPVLEPCDPPVHQDQVVPQQSTLGLGPHDADQAAGVQVLVLVEGVGQLVHRLQGEGEGEGSAEGGHTPPTVT